MMKAVSAPQTLVQPGAAAGTRPARRRCTARSRTHVSRSVLAAVRGLVSGVLGARHGPHVPTRTVEGQEGQAVGLFFPAIRLDDHRRGAER